MIPLKNPCSQCPECCVDMSTSPAVSVPDWNSETCKCCYVTYLMVGFNRLINCRVEVNMKEYEKFQRGDEL